MGYSYPRFSLSSLQELSFRFVLLISWSSSLSDCCAFYASTKCHMLFRRFLTFESSSVHKLTILCNTCGRDATCFLPIAYFRVVNRAPMCYHFLHLCPVSQVQKSALTCVLSAHATCSVPDYLLWGRHLCTSPLSLVTFVRMPHASSPISHFRSINCGPMPLILSSFGG